MEGGEGKVKGTGCCEEYVSVCVRLSVDGSSG